MRLIVLLKQEEKGTKMYLVTKGSQPTLFELLLFNNNVMLEGMSV